MRDNGTDHDLGIEPLFIGTIAFIVIRVQEARLEWARKSGFTPQTPAPAPTIK